MSVKGNPFSKWQINYKTFTTNQTKTDPNHDRYMYRIFDNLISQQNISYTIETICLKSSLNVNMYRQEFVTMELFVVPMWYLWFCLSHGTLHMQRLFLQTKNWWAQIKQSDCKAVRSFVIATYVAFSPRTVYDCDH